MGLKLALEAHKNQNVREAIKHYTIAIEEGDKSPVIFQNYGVLLKHDGLIEKAEHIYQIGLTHHPNHLGILQNYGNLYLISSPSKSLKIFFRSCVLFCLKTSRIITLLVNC